MTNHKYFTFDFSTKSQDELYNPNNPNFLTNLKKIGNSNINDVIYSSLNNKLSLFQQMYYNRPKRAPTINSPIQTNQNELDLTSEQLQILEKEFLENTYLFKSRRFLLSKKTNLSSKELREWFQSRRIQQISDVLKLESIECEKKCRLQSSACSTSDICYEILFLENREHFYDIGYFFENDLLDLSFETFSDVNTSTFINFSDVMDVDNITPTISLL